MHRILFQLGMFTVYSYGFMLALAFLVGTYLAQSRAGKQGIGPNIIMDLIFYILLSSIAGARIFFVAVNWGYYRFHLADVFKVWEGGLVFYGGLVLALPAAFWFLKKNKLSFWKIADILSPSLAIGVALGRIGCFLNGCCYGKVSEVGGVCFPGAENPPVFAEQVFNGLIPPEARYSLPVIPTQVYESLSAVAIFLILVALERRKRFDGFIFLSFVLLYSLARFVVEGFRYYEPNFILFGGLITVSQLISIILAVVSGFLLIKGLAGLRK
ncbi:MAG: prolipoprotein diacylglyceryl transferase [Candidatus Omnitrophica bacterium]|nr:prolipoprotein diacylglyceryl transferase [Candidatus Omnitrophota bacterium]